jgi:DnaD/phage-associated family protein
MQIKDDKSQKQRELALRRWHPEAKDANAMPSVLPKAIPEKHKGNTLKESKGKESKGNNKESKEKDEIFNFYTDNYGLITEFISEQLKDLCNTYTDEKVIIALKKAVSMNKRNLSYVEGILKNNGFKTSSDSNPNRVDGHKLMAEMKAKGML